VATRSGVPAGVFTLVLLVCLGLLGFAEYLQHGLNLDPCPWCIAQRLVYLAIALDMLIAGLHRPGPAGARIYTAIGALLALAGAAAAGYHLYIQSDPRRAASCVGSWLERTLDASKVGKAIPPLLQYDGTCELKPWSFLGLNIPEWSLVWFIILLVGFAVLFNRARR
jgi:disulfide bond formation protein DsbB